MKRFYTFEPKNFRIFDKMKGFIAVALLMLMAVGNVNAQVYQLVTSVSDLAVGDTVIIAANGANYAISTTQNTNNRPQASIVKTGDFASWTSNNVEKFVVENGAVDNTFAFRATGHAGYIYAASSSSNNLKTKSNMDDDASWAVTIESNGQATAIAQGGNTRNNLRYNSSSSLFSAYGSGQQPICFYKRLACEVSSVAVEPSVNTAVATWTSKATDFNAECNSQTLTGITKVGDVWTCNISGLNPNTAYTFKVKTDCATEYTEVNFTTTCPVYTDNTVNASIYEGQTYTFHGNDYTEANTYTVPLTDAYGCDSTVTLVLEVLPPLNVHREAVSACDSYTLEKLNGTELICTETNIYYDTLPGAAEGGWTVSTLWN